MSSDCRKTCPLAEAFKAAGRLEVGRLTVFPGDVLVLRVEAIEPAREAEVLERFERLAARLFPGVKALVLRRGVDLAVAHQAGGQSGLFDG